MKKLWSLLISLLIFVNMSVYAFAEEIPQGWRELTEEELELLIEDEESNFIQEQRNKAITDEEYAALYAPIRDDIDTLKDIEIAGKYLGENGMKYSVEPYKEPTFTEIDRLYYCTDVLLYTGHGYYDRVSIEPYGDGYPEEKYTGVYMGRSSITDGKATLVGIGRKSMSDCRFVLFACCLTASPNHADTNLAQYVTTNGAQTSIGWKVKVGSPDLHKWEEIFFSELNKGATIGEAVKKAHANSSIYEFPDDILANTTYGNKNQKLSENKDRSIQYNNENEYIKVNETLDIDCKNGDLEELTKYFEENIEGFDSNLFEIELINNYVDGEDCYVVLYGLELNGFKTPYKVTAFVEDDNIEYIPSFNNDDIEKLSLLPNEITDNMYDMDVEMALKEAEKEVPDDSVMEEQTAVKMLDEDLNPYIMVKTSCVDEHGGYFVLTYKYELS